MISTEEIRQRYVEARQRDISKGYLRDELAFWEYVAVSRGMEHYQQITSFSGIQNLSDWIRWHGPAPKADLPRTPPPKVPPSLEHGAHQGFRSIWGFLAAMGIDPGGLESQCHLTAYLNAHDFYFATTFSPTPVRVIDFGAGFGRNAFAFSELKDSVYCAIDAVEKSYCLQSLTLKYLYSEPHLLLEYTDSPGITKDQVTGFIERGGRAIHLPAWRLDLLPAHLFNVLMMVWVFHELNPRAARAVLDLIAARMPPRAIVYAQGGFHTKVHRINLDRSLRARNYARLLLLDGHTFDWDSLPMIRDVRLFRRQPPQKQRSRLGRLVHIVNSLLAGVPHKIYRALRPARQPAPKGPPQ